MATRICVYMPSSSALSLAVSIETRGRLARIDEQSGRRAGSRCRRGRRLSGCGLGRDVCGSARSEQWSECRRNHREGRLRVWKRHLQPAGSEWPLCSRRCPGLDPRCTGSLVAPRPIHRRSLGPVAAARAAANSGSEQRRCACPGPAVDHRIRSVEAFEARARVDAVPP